MPPPTLPSILNIFQAAPELTPVTHRLHAITAMGHTITHSLSSAHDLEPDIKFSLPNP